jgi:SNF2 family DNA or RNA helicase
LNHALTLDALNSEKAQQYLQALETGAAKLKHRFYTHDSFGSEKINRFRLSLYTLETGDYSDYVQKHASSEVTGWLQRFFLKEPLEISWLKTRFLDVQRSILNLKLASFCATGFLADQMPDLLGHYLPLRETEAYLPFDPIFLMYDMWAGNTKKAAQTLSPVLATVEEENPSGTTLRGILAFLEGNNDEALSYFEDALKSLRKLTNKKKVLLGRQETIFYALALFKANNRQNHSKIKTLLTLAAELMPRPYDIFANLSKVLLKLQGLESKVAFEAFKFDRVEDPVSRAIGALASFWFDEKQVDKEKCQEQFLRHQTLLPLIGKIYAEILHKIDPEYQQEYETYLGQERFKGLIRFRDCVHMGEDWERALNNLDHFFDRQGSAASQGPKRLVWYFDPTHKGVEVLEQVQQARGGWSKGKAISLKRFHEKDLKLDYLTDEDKRVIKTPQFERHSWHYQPSYSWDNLKTPLALVGHPCVYHAKNPDLRLDLVLGAVSLVIKQQASGYFHLSLSHTAYRQDIFIEKETPSRYRVVSFPETLSPLVDILGTAGLRVPAQAKDHLVSLIQKASPVLSIHSEGDVLDDVPAQEGDTTPCLQIMPLNDGLKISLLVRPFSDQGPYFRPGKERASLLLFLDGKPLKANRSLKEEKKRAEALLQACPVLQRSQDGSDEWIVEDPEDCLEILSELQELTQPSPQDLTSDLSPTQTQDSDKCRVEWPEGQKLFVTPSSSFKNLSLKILSERDWLSVQGSFKVDEDTVLGFEKLLELLDQSKGRFIPLAGNKFLALSAHFKKHLQDLKAISEETGSGANKAYRLHTLGSLALQKFADKAASVEGDQKWKEKLKSFKKAETYQPKLPATLQADLRDYQREGFEWISRLASLGMGVCLADDMGLGKTIQALAVLLDQAPQGPCLVVAPTSVCHNWIAEMAKFAPTLVPHTFGDSKRDTLVKSLKAMDVLICSYTLLQQEEEILEAKKWQMIVLDEAQAIKNAGTKRFQVATKLQGTVRLALTGTPIENHLEEIWSLFRFIAPGLLGSREGFQKRFLTPLEKDKDQGKDKSRMMGLKKLIQLFVLRRTKNAVLQELPPRTEQTILIEMTPEEVSFYEALRRQALTKLSNLHDQEKGGGQRKIHILAEITRLRRACCHPILVDKDITLGSSKMKVFLELVEELLDNNHQALVFSQYVGYLALVREELDKKGISYQYLDGSTPSAERKKQVEAFQAGKSSLFLLSLKAGGTGLNLTAADYVIHLDPWWNPAVEDQASDRSHRMGQQRPVTIYRLIMQNSIEEKIGELHKNKRELANEILEGSHTPIKMSEEDLLSLLSSGL